MNADIMTRLILSKSSNHTPECPRPGYPVLPVKSPSGKILNKMLK
jgi:hypothetical protein